MVFRFTEIDEVIANNKEEFEVQKKDVRLDFAKVKRMITQDVASQIEDLHDRIDELNKKIEKVQEDEIRPLEKQNQDQAAEIETLKQKID